MNNISLGSPSYQSLYGNRESRDKESGSNHQSCCSLKSRTKNLRQMCLKGTASLSMERQNQPTLTCGQMRMNNSQLTVSLEGSRMSWLAIRSEKNFSCCIPAPKYSFKYGEAFLTEGGVCARHYDFICFFFLFLLTLEPALAQKPFLIYFFRKSSYAVPWPLICKLNKQNDIINN